MRLSIRYLRLDGCIYEPHHHRLVGNQCRRVACVHFQVTSGARLHRRHTAGGGLRHLGSIGRISRHLAAMTRLERAFY
jgi:hypothetical protein